MDRMPPTRRERNQVNNMARWNGGINYKVVFVVLIRIVLAVVFLYSGFSKVISSPHFAFVLRDTYSLPETLARSAAVFIPGLEICVGLTMLLGHAIRETALIVIILILAFTSFYVAAALFAGGSPPDCGCFGRTQTAGLGISWTLVRNCALLVLSALVLKFGKMAPSPENGS